MYTLTEKLKFIDGVFGRGQLASNGKNIAVRCPICDPRDQNKKKLIIKVEDDLVHCWVCGFKARSLAPLLRRFASQTEFNLYREKFMPEAIREAWKSSVLDVQELRLPDGFTLLPLANVSDPDVLAALRYASSRGLTNHDFWYYKIGVTNDQRYRRRLIVPSFDNTGTLNYFTSRTVDRGDRRPKYDNPNIDKRDVIFNEINVEWSTRLVLCEGPFDAMKCGKNVVPLLGSDLSEESRLFNSILLNNTPVAIALDADMWYTKTPRLVKKLCSYNVDVTVVDLRGESDPGAMSKQQFADLLSMAKEPSWEESFFDRLNDKLSKSSRSMFITL